MFALTACCQYMLYHKPCDMRKSFDGLCALVKSELGRQPTSGEVYIFLNKSRSHIKLLRWEPGGFVLYYKRLEEGTFTPPIRGQHTYLSWHDLVSMIEGIQVQKSIRKRRFQLGKKVEIS